MSFKAVLNTTRLVGLYSRLTPKAKQAVIDTSESMRDRASHLAPRRTGSLAASLYVTTPDGSDYSERASAARSLNPLAVIIPEVTPDQVLSLSSGGKGYIGVVGIAVQHGIFNELGTRYMAPQPFMLPAAEPERDGFLQLMRHVVDG